LGRAGGCQGKLVDGVDIGKGVSACRPADRAPGETRDRPRFADGSPRIRRDSCARCVRRAKTDWTVGEAGGVENPGRSSARAHLRSSKRSSVRHVSATSRDRKRADAARVRLRDVTRALGRFGRTRRTLVAGSMLAGCRIQGSRANTPAGCARSVGFAADLRRGSLCGVQRGSRRARMWRAVHTPGARAVCCARVGHGSLQKTSEGPKDSLMRAREKETDPAPD